MPPKKVPRAAGDTAASAREPLIEALVFVIRVSVGSQPMVDVLRRLHARGMDVTSSELETAVKQDHARRAAQHLAARFAATNKLGLRGKTAHLTWLVEQLEAPALKQAAPKPAVKVQSQGSLPAGSGAAGGTSSVVERVLVALGVHDVTRTPLTNDAGVDVRGVLVIEPLMRVRVAVQVKRYSGNLSWPDIQKLRGSLSHGEVDWFFTTGGYSEGAWVEAQAKDRQPISLISGLEVADLLIKYNVAFDDIGQAPPTEKA